MKRERMRSRFHVAALLAATGLLLAACSNHFGPGIADLPASEGWQPLPIGSWVLNDGLEARSMVFCPRDACTRQGFAAVIALDEPSSALDAATEAALWHGIRGLADDGATVLLISHRRSAREIADRVVTLSATRAEVGA